MKCCKWITSLIFLLAAVTPVAAAQQKQNIYASSANAGTQRTQKVEKGTPLAQVLRLIENEYEVHILYNSGLMAGKTLTKTREFYFKRNIYDLLDELLPAFGFTYKKLTHRTLGIVPKQEVYLMNNTVQETISGTVTDGQTGNTLPGVNIRVKRTNTGTATDANGHYELSVESLQDTLVFSFVGYQTRQVPINGQTIINIEMQPKALQGEEMVVIGYGQTSKKNLTGSVSSVQGEDLEDLPAAGVDQVLQGRATGVRVTRPSGDPNLNAQIIVRGGNSINGNNSPLYVVDGAIQGQNFNLSYLDVSDIKSIDILKDATAVGIYGTQGSNGVVLITTKDGAGVQAGKIQVDVNAYGGFQSLQNSVDLMNGPESAKYSNDAARYRGEPIPYPNPDDRTTTDWIGAITRKAPIAKGNIAVSGVSSNRNTNYRISGNYFNQEGIVNNSGIKKYQLRTNIDFKLSDYIKTGVRIKASRIFHNNNKVSVYRVVQNDGPSRPIYNDKGEFSAVSNPSEGGNIKRNPVADFKLRDDQTADMYLSGQAYLQIEPINNLIFKTTFSPTLNNTRLEQYNPTTLPMNRETTQEGDARVRTLSSLGLLNENTINYSTDLNATNHFELLGGFTWQTNQIETSDGHAYGFSNDVVKFHNLKLGSDPTRNTLSSSWSSYQLVSWLGRVRYSFRDTYLFTLVGRIDGSSRFATAKNQYGFFPAGSFALRLSQYPFFKKINAISNLKIKASYGISGSQAIGAYRTLPILNGQTILFNEQPQAGILLGRPANPDLRWETTKQLNVGLDAGFVGGRLSFNAEYYNKKTEDLLLNKQIASQTGFNSKLVNIGAVRNQGLEFEINSKNIVKRNFQWSTNITWSANRNKALNLGGSPYINTVSARIGAKSRLIPGHSVPVFVGVKYLGTWKSQDEIDASDQAGTGVVPGGPRFEDTDGDGQITVQDYHIIGKPQPDFYGGVGNTFRYKNISLNVFFQGSYGNEILNTFSKIGFFGGGVNRYKEALNYWTPENRDSNIPAPGTFSVSPNPPINTKYIEDGSYLRLKHLQLTYNLPVEKMNLTSFKKVSVFFSGENLLLISNFKLFDPETSLYGNTTTRAGFARGEYPYSSIITFGIKAGL